MAAITKANHQLLFCVVDYLIYIVDDEGRVDSEITICFTDPWQRLSPGFLFSVSETSSLTVDWNRFLKKKNASRPIVHEPACLSIWRDIPLISISNAQPLWSPHIIIITVLLLLCLCLSTLKFLFLCFSISKEDLQTRSRHVKSGTAVIAIVVPQAILELPPWKI